MSPRPRGQEMSPQVFLPFMNGRNQEAPVPEKEPVDTSPDETPTEETAPEPIWKMRIRALLKSLEEQIDALDDNSRFSPNDLVAQRNSPAHQIAEIAVGEFGRIPFTELLTTAARRGDLGEFQGRVSDLLDTPEQEVPVRKRKTA